MSLMCMHFISSGQNFPYSYYLAIKSAIKTQEVDRPILWLTQHPAQYGEYDYFALVENIIETRFIEAPRFSGLLNVSSQFVSAHVKDYLEWRILYEYGGLFLDLDTFAIKDSIDLLDPRKEVVATPYHNPEYSISPFNNAIILAHSHSKVIEECLDKTARILSTTSLDSDDWGISGPGVWSRAIMNNLDKVCFPPYGIWGKPWWSVEDQISIIDAFKEDGELSGVERILHLFASSHQMAFENIDEQFMAKSNVLLARIGRRVLSDKELNPYGRELYE